MQPLLRQTQHFTVEEVRLRWKNTQHSYIPIQNSFFRSSVHGIQTSVLDFWPTSYDVSSVDFSILRCPCWQQNTLWNVKNSKSAIQAGSKTDRWHHNNEHICFTAAPVVVRNTTLLSPSTLWNLSVSFNTCFGFMVCQCFGIVAGSYLAKKV